MKKKKFFYCVVTPAVGNRFIEPYFCNSYDSAVDVARHLTGLPGVCEVSIKSVFLSL